MSSKLLEVPVEIYKNAPKFFDRTEESLQEDVETIKNWMQTQPHLPAILEDECIRNYLMMNKCCIEKTKQNIDMYFTARTLLPQIYQHFNPPEDKLRVVMRASACVAVPKMTEDMYRVIVLQVLDAKLLQQINVYEEYAVNYSLVEIRLREDYMFGEVIISDFSNMSLKLLTKYTPAFLSQTAFIEQKVFCNRVKAIYFINAPAYLDTVLALLKTLMSPKVFQRIRVCSDESILHKDLSPEVIPKDYGGKAQSIQELQDLWFQKIQSYQGRFQKLATLKVDEELRPKHLQNDDILGFYGNFKKLNVD